MLSAAALPLLLAQGGLSLRWGNVSSGYGISSGDGYTIAGTGGEVDGSGPLTGDGYQVTGGFWSGVDEPPPYPTPPPHRRRHHRHNIKSILPSTIDR